MTSNSILFIDFLFIKINKFEYRIANVDGCLFSQTSYNYRLLLKHARKSPAQSARSDSTQVLSNSK